VLLLGQPRLDDSLAPHSTSAKLELCGPFIRESVVMPSTFRDSGQRFQLGGVVVFALDHGHVIPISRHHRFGHITSVRRRVDLVKGKTVRLTVMATKKWVNDRFGELVIREREAKNPKWTQKELADKLADKGVSLHWTTIAKIEKGQRGVRLDEAAAFADVLNCSVDHLLGRRSRPAADRDFAMQRLATSVVDAQRSVQVSMRDITITCTDIVDLDAEGKFADVIAAVRKGVDQLDDVARELARIGSKIAEKRGTRRVLKGDGQWVKDA
jgi:Helix-turn-helix